MLRKNDLLLVCIYRTELLVSTQYRINPEKLYILSCGKGRGCIALWNSNEKNKKKLAFVQIIHMYLLPRCSIPHKIDIFVVVTGALLEATGDENAPFLLTGAVGVLCSIVYAATIYWKRDVVRVFHDEEKIKQRESATEMKPIH